MIELYDGQITDLLRNNPLQYDPEVMALGGRMAITPRIAVPAIPDEITMTHTGRVGLQMTATVTLPLPEIP